jgi:predicted glycogen debranching enzyme
MSNNSRKLGRSVCGNLETSTSREWLVTNGIGGYASGTISGILTCRYQGLLVANFPFDSHQTLLLTKIDETATYNNCTYSLFANRWRNENVSSHGYVHIESFYLDGTIPVWHYACADALLEKRIWMQEGVNTTYVQYGLVRGSQPLLLNLKAFVNYRNSHHLTISRNWKFSLQSVPKGICVKAYPEALPFYLLSDRGTTFPVNTWYYNFNLAAETGHYEDHLHASTLEVVLHPGESLTYVASTELDPSLDGKAALNLRQDRDRKAIAFWSKTNVSRAGKQTPSWIEELVLTANSFIIGRSSPEVAIKKAIVTEYRSLGNWGRDSAIALPGLSLTLGRPDLARLILQNLAAFVDRGMLPNCIPETGEAPQYNTVDSSLWYFEAIRQYYQVTEDEDLLKEVFPVLREIIDWYCRGTRHNIHLDASDGLLYAGETGVPLTWMDAKVGDWVVTPRIGKPVEINALWYNALRAIAQFARYLNYPYQEYEAIADRVLARFSRFWQDRSGYCFDVIDTPEGNDPALRPNQIFAVSLPESPLNPQQQKSVVNTCAQELLTSYGLRSLSPQDARYQGAWGGDRWEQAGAYHQGSVWGWLLGPFALAHLRVYGNPAQARQFLLPMAQNLSDRGLGYLSQIFDGDPPFTPRGGMAHSLAVAEFLRAWAATE